VLAVMAAATNASASRTWLDAGVVVFPCNPIHKCPLIKWRRPKSPDAAETVPLTIEEARDAWRPGRQGADGMPALDCDGTSVVVIDCDVKAGWRW
jgi:hypothetical protein